MARPVNSEAQSELVTLLTAAQPQLYSYITTLLGDVHAASNVLQETNIVLWTKADEFRPGSNFLAWAREIAYYKALAYIRELKRDRLIVDYRLVEKAFARLDRSDENERRLALRHCLSQLSEPQRQLLRVRYAEGVSIASMAKQQDKTESAVTMALGRIRQALMACVKRRLATAS